MRVHINEIKGKKAGYKIRWTEDGKPKEAFRKEYKDAETTYLVAMLLI